MTERENTLRAIRFERPDHVPVRFAINASCWDAYPQEALAELMQSHPLLFGREEIPALPYRPVYTNVARKDQPYVDDWGCLWETTCDGITGTVTRHPLADWDSLKEYRYPDPEVCMGIGRIDWEKERARIRARKEAGLLTKAGLRHGHTFLQVCDIRGYEQVLFDMEDEEPRLKALLEKIVEFNLAIIQKYLDMDVDIISYAEDLGMQVGPMLSPDNFEMYFSPLYRRMMEPAVQKGTIIHMHSDGDVRTLLPYLIQNGVNIVNVQDLVNGIDWIEENIKGRVCIDLDIDRQKITPFGTPEQVRALVREEIHRLGTREGGLMLTYGLYPGVPLENIKALMDALEDYAFHGA